MVTVINENQLDGFRSAWAGREILGLPRQHGGRVAITWPVGVGKSHNIDDVIEAAVHDAHYDLVLVLCPTRQTIKERRWVIKKPAGIKLTVLNARPAEKCGKDRDRRWSDFERRGLGLHGRQQICGHCPHLSRCPWPEQYGKRLAHYQVIYGTQSHLVRDANFVSNIQRWTQAERPLVILDEDKALTCNATVTITREQLERFAGIVTTLSRKHHAFKEWEALCRALLARITSDDLRAPGWRLPWLTQDMLGDLQRRGESRHPGTFEDIHFQLQAFCQSPLQSRELYHGHIQFAAPPRIPSDLLVYSGTAAPEFLEFRLGEKLADPFKEHHFCHSGTRWYNLALRSGARCNFEKNAPQILDFFAGLSAKRMHEGWRPLFVTKKCFVELCRQGLIRRLAALGLPGIKVACGDWHRWDLNDRRVVPLITYGIIGTNLFERFDTAYCLNSFNVSEDVVSSTVQDLTAQEYGVALQIVTDTAPLRRRVVVDTRHRYADIGTLANHALRMHEMDTVVQAVGRVRPFTKPREIITFQAADHPYGGYTQEFSMLGEAREFFGVLGQRAGEKEATATSVASAKREGITQSEAANRLGVSTRTIKRYWWN